MTATLLTETSPELLEALNDVHLFGNTEWTADVLHTGGGCMVARIFQSNGSEIWLTREDEVWIVGFYNFALDEEDEGICLELRGHMNYQTNQRTTDDPKWVAQQVFGMVERL
jgi:hypothetical protein